MDVLQSSVPKRTKAKLKPLLCLSLTKMKLNIEADKPILELF